MKVVLDTTVFENGFNSRSAEVSLLNSFLTRTKSELCIPGVVFEEALNRVRKRTADANSKIDSLHRLTGGEEGFHKVKPDDVLHSYDESLKRLLQDLSARILSYPVVAHEELVKRSLVPTKPFVERGRGYRDALTWHSLLELVRDGAQEVVFISENSEDWWESAKVPRFHYSFLKELEALGFGPSRLLIVPNLAEFNRQYTVSGLPVEPVPAGGQEAPIDYLQLLRGRQEAVETMIQDALPRVLRAAAGVWVGDLEVIATSVPDEITPFPIREVDKERRLLQLSALYRVAAEFLIKKIDLPIWSWSFSFHMRRDWEQDTLKVQATIRVKAMFRMIMRGDEIGSFSLGALMITAWGLSNDNPAPVGS